MTRSDAEREKSRWMGEIWRGMERGNVPIGEEKPAGWCWDGIAGARFSPCSQTSQAAAISTSVGVRAFPRGEARTATSETLVPAQTPGQTPSNSSVYAPGMAEPSCTQVSDTYNFSSRHYLGERAFVAQWDSI